MERRAILVVIAFSYAFVPRGGLAFLAQPPRSSRHSEQMQQLVVGILAYLREILNGFEKAEQNNTRVSFPSSDTLLEYQRQLTEIAADPGPIEMSKDPAVLKYAETVFSQQHRRLPAEPAGIIREFANAIGDLARALRNAAVGTFGPEQGGNLTIRQTLGALFDAINAVLQIGSVMGLLFQAA
jgi:hypothetical protein